MEKAATTVQNKLKHKQEEEEKMIGARRSLDMLAGEALEKCSKILHMIWYNSIEYISGLIWYDLI